MENNLQIYGYASAHDLPEEPCFIDARLAGGSELINCRVEVSFLVKKEVDIYWRSARITKYEIVQWRYSAELL